MNHLPSTITQPLPQTVGALSAILACQLMVVLDGTVIYTALPHLRVALAFSYANLAWVQNAYMLTFGGLLLLGARTGDILGHRRVFIAANLAFALASAIGGLAPNAAWLLIARTAQGIAAAFAAPCALALLMLLYPQGAARTRALSLYTAVSGAGSAIGLVLGGILTELISWRSILFINLPICAALLIASRDLPQSSKDRIQGCDAPGAFTITLGMSSLVYGLIRAASHGFDSSVIVTLLASGLLLMTFIFIEKHSPYPITPLELFRNTERSGAYLSKMLLIGGMLGTFFHLTQYVQEILHYDAFQTGLTFVPLSLTQLFMVIYGAPKLSAYMSDKQRLIAGLVVAGIGMMWLARLSAETPLFTGLVLPIVMLGLGTGAALVPLASAGIAGVAPHNAGAASGLMNVTHYVGGALGTAIVVFVVNLTTDSALLSPSNKGVFDTPYQATLSHALSISAFTSTVFFALALCIVLGMMRRCAP